MKVDLDALIGIIELLDKAEFSQFRFEQGDMRIEVSRDGLPLSSAGSAHAASRGAPEVHSPAPAPVPTAPQTTPAPAGAEAGPGETLVRSPLLGTFYRSPKPGAPAFVEVGQAVDVESTLCIVEVMKLMNSVAAGVNGEIVRILVEDGELVEHDQPLFVIRNAA